MERKEIHIKFWWENQNERPRHGWEDNIKVDVREIRWGGIDLIDLAQDRDQWRVLVNMLMIFQTT
jgi:hypothetical protein